MKERLQFWKRQTLGPKTEQVQPTLLPDSETIPFQDTARRALSYIQERWGNFIPFSTHVATRGQDLKVFVTRDMSKFDEARRGKPLKNKKLAERLKYIGGLHSFGTGMITVLHPESVWEGLQADDKNNYIKDFGGTQEKPSEEFKQAARERIVTHEVLHGHHDPRLPTYVHEIAVRWYEKDTLSNFSKKFITNDLQKKSAEFYEKMLKKHGDDIHKYFFGTLDNNLKALYFKLRFWLASKSMFRNTIYA